MSPNDGPLSVAHELAFRTQYAELKERVRVGGPLLPGTPGTLVQRSGTGRVYWYRAYQTAAGRQVEDLVGRDGDVAARQATQAAIDAARWAGAQVRALRKLGFQVADKGAAQVLVDLHNAELLQAGLCLVGTLAYMAWLNELGVRAVAARTEDVDLAARQTLKLAAPRSFADVLASSRLGFAPVPALSRRAATSTLKTPGASGLRVDLLTHGPRTGETVAMPLLQWHAQTVAHFDYLLEQPHEGALLAGGHCIPLLLPAAERFVWHKFFAAAVRTSFPEKAAKDLRQAATLAAALTQQDDEALCDAAVVPPLPMRRAILRKRGPLRAALQREPAALRAIEQVLTLG